MLAAIAVIGQKREIGRDNSLIFAVPGDLPRFKRITSGHPIIMGRKTYESIGRPLPNRTNIVISRSLQSEGVIVVGSLTEALATAKKSAGADEIFVIGGGQIFAQAMPKIERLYLTIVEATEPLADSFFPDYSEFKKIVSEEWHEEGGMRYRYVVLERV